MKVAILKEQKKMTFYKWKKIGAGCRGGCFWQRLCNVVPEGGKAEKVPDLRRRLVK